MWTKIYLILLAVALVAMGFLTYLSYTLLQSTGFAPRDIADSFLGFAATYWTFFWISSLVLLILANVVLWQTRRAWALWLTLLYFSIFVLVRTWWLNEVYSAYAKQNNLAADGFFGYGILGVLICIAVAVGIFFNQFLILKMRDRMNNVDKPAETAEIVVNEEKQAIEDKE